MTLNFLIMVLVIGTHDKEDMAHYVFSVSAEQAIDVEEVEVDGGNMFLLQSGLNHLLGFINAESSARIAGQDLNF